MHTVYFIYFDTNEIFYHQIKNQTSKELWMWSDNVTKSIEDGQICHSKYNVSESNINYLLIYYYC